MLSHLSSPKHKAFRSEMGNTLLVTKLTDTVSGVLKDMSIHATFHSPLQQQTMMPL